MKLLNLKVVDLHGYYNYDVTFNEDITFIYGENGCGKTTILNITEAIITGALYKLFAFKFSRIVLSYAQSSDLENKKTIAIRTLRKNIAIMFEGTEHTLYRNIYDEMNYGRNKPGALQEYYFDKYDFLSEIKNTFNYVYLPLNRSQNSFYDHFSFDNRVSRNMQMHFRYAIDDVSDGISNAYPSAIEKAVLLIRRQHSLNNANIRKINDEFRNKILKASLESITSADDFLEIIRESETRDKFIRVKDSYIAMMQEIVSASEPEVNTYKDYFDKFISEYHAYKSNTDAKSISVELLLMYQNVKKTERLVKIAEEAEKRKSEVQKSLKLFLNIMNDFIGNGEEKKQLCIDSEGELYLTTQNREEKIGLQQMSSGEKQLLTFFAHLIFGVKRSNTGIFVVDEPELSLHLSWQKKFVEKALTVNENVQFIFATHAPEIIGRYRDKMFRLTKTHAK